MIWSLVQEQKNAYHPLNLNTFFRQTLVFKEPKIKKTFNLTGSKITIVILRLIEFKIIYNNCRCL